jgi:hypothetical protein
MSGFTLRELLVATGVLCSLENHRFQRLLPRLTVRGIPVLGSTELLVQPPHTHRRGLIPTSPHPA